MTTEQLKEIITAAHSLGAKKITIEGDKVTIEWGNSVTISSPIYQPIEHGPWQETGPKPGQPAVPESLYAYAVPFPRR